MHQQSQVRVASLAQEKRRWWKPFKTALLILLGLTSLLLVSIVMLIK